MAAPSERKSTPKVIMALMPKPITMTFNCGNVRLISPSTSVASSTAVTTGAVARTAT